MGKLTPAIVLFLSMGVTVACDTLLYWGGYLGKLSFLSFEFPRMACIPLALVTSVILVFKRVKSGAFKQAVCFGILFIMVSAYALMTKNDSFPFHQGAVSRFRNEIDPLRLQQWACHVVNEHPGEDYLYLPPREIPEFAKIPSWRMSGATVRENSSGRYLRISWGAGVAGNYGILVGPTNFVTAHGLYWQPGVYFYRMR